MAIRHLLGLRRLAAGTPAPLNFTQRRWAQVHDLRFLTTHATDRVVDKYRAKLDQKARQEGVRDVDELKAKYKDKIADLRKQASVPGVNSTANPFEAPAPATPTRSPPPPPPPTQESAERLAQAATGTPGVKTLSSYMDVEKTAALPAKEIELLWRLRHANNPRSVCATVPLATFQEMAAAAKKFPQFVLPVPKPDQGAEMHLLQWTFPAPDTVTVIFTHLAEFQLRGEYSQPHTTVTHHLELAADKQLVLLQGQVIEGRGVSVDEAQWLVMCLQKFYFGDSPQRTRLLEMFGRGDPAFSVEELLEEAEKLV